MPASITRNVSVEVTISGFEMGKAFANMDAGEQARFFTGIRAVTESWGKPSCFQWQMMREYMGPDGLNAFRSMAEYAE